MDLRRQIYENMLSILNIFFLGIFKYYLASSFTEFNQVVKIMVPYSVHLPSTDGEKHGLIKYVDTKAKCRHLKIDL